VQLLEYDPTALVAVAVVEQIGCVVKLTAD
jgi:hypothetical protein